MNIIIADDEPLALEMTCEAVREVCPKANIYPFSKPSRLLEFAKETRCKIAFLDICIIGKVGIDEKILNKPGRLTNEEFEEMKKHTLIGASMLKSLGVYQNEELVKVAYQICRWHHERYDGKGYPDGLKGEEIPIAAQVVSVADVYDALTSERVYKKAFSHEKAMEMILAGECGTFNPLLLECLQDIQGNIQVEMKRAAEQPMLVQNSYVGKMIETVQ